MIVWYLMMLCGDLYTMIQYVYIGRAIECEEERKARRKTESLGEARKDVHARILALLPSVFQDDSPCPRWRYSLLAALVVIVTYAILLHYHCITTIVWSVSQSIVCVGRPKGP